MRHYFIINPAAGKGAAKGLTAKLEALSQEFSEAEQAYKDGSLEAGKKMTDLREEAEALATAAYESSEWAQAVHDAELDQINATRELTTAMEAATNAWRENNAFSKGGADGNALLKFFGIGRTQEEQQARTASMEAQGDPMLVDIGGASGLASGRRAKGYAVGLDYVPYDEFPALLHQGERVKTAAEARMEDRSGGAVSVTITGNEFNVRGESDVDDIAEKIARKLQDALLRGG